MTLGKRGMEKNGRKGGDEKLAVRISERGMVLGDWGLRQGKGVGRRVGNIKIMKGGLTREQKKAKVVVVPPLSLIPLVTLVLLPLPFSLSLSVAC